jgi:RNA 3'-terminal phosphate cyclase (ATP)
MIVIDGSQGEGGGQILRTALALAVVTGKPFQLDNVRAGREKPGLMRQHLTALRAAAEISGADVEGDELGSTGVLFNPLGVRPGRYHFKVGTAGSATLVLQTVLPALMVADAASELILEGGTHNPFAPPFDFLEKCFLPLIGKMGPRINARLERPGFYPAGGGRFSVHIEPVKKLQRLELLESGDITRKVARVLVAGLPADVAQRELRVLERQLGWPLELLKLEAIDAMHGPGNVVVVELESAALTEVITGFGQKGITAEAVAESVVREVRRYLAAGVPVGEHLADQLLVPLAMAGKGTFRTVRLTRHASTNMKVIEMFLDVRLGMENLGPNGALIWIDDSA